MITNHVLESGFKIISLCQNEFHINVILTLHSFIYIYSSSKKKSLYKYIFNCLIVVGCSEIH